MTSLSVVLLTWNEERNVRGCLESLARQHRRVDEVVLVDAASPDGTVALAREAEQAGLPFPLRIVVAERRIPIGEARNRGVALAKGPLVAFLSADAEANGDWARQAVASLGGAGGGAGADMVFGHQRHAPRRWTAGAAVRGLRYHYPAHEVDEPVRFASNVCAAYRRDLLLAFPFDPEADACEDLLLARRAASAGWRAAYNPHMKAVHHDVEDARAEMRKAVHEGRASGRHAGELGVQWPVLAWGGGLLGSAAMLPAGAWAVGLFGLVLWAPALRRLLRRNDMPAAAKALGVVASPPFDLVYLANYVAGLAQGARHTGRLRSTSTTP